jgi:hypothetical protein
MAVRFMAKQKRGLTKKERSVLERIKQEVPGVGTPEELARFMTTYADSGVNVELGDDASRVLYNAAKLTWENRKRQFGEVIEFFPDFSG